MRMAHERVVGPGLVVTDDEHDVRGRARSGARPVMLPSIAATIASRSVVFMGYLAAYRYGFLPTAYRLLPTVYADRLPPTADCPGSDG